MLAAGHGAVLSHRSAAFRWGLLAHAPARVDVTIARTTRTRLSGVNVHRSRRAVEPVIRDAIPVTPVERTVLDLADVVGYDVLHRVAMDAEHRRLLRLADLRPIPGRAGNGRVARLLEHVRERTRSELEKEVLAIVRRAGLPEPQRNAVVGPFVVDLAWPRERVIVEADGWRWHSSREAFERDRARDVRLSALGWVVLRVTWRQLREEPRLLVDALGVGEAGAQAVAA